MPRQKASSGPGAADRILVPLDLSPLSDQALDLARRLGGPRARLRLFHASPPVQTALYVGEGGVVPVYDRALSAMQREHALKELGRKAAGLGPRADIEVVEAAQAAQAIAQAARRFKADRVVMTTHGRGGISRLFSGSVAQRLFHLHRGPIVLLRPQHKKR